MHSAKHKSDSRTLLEMAGFALHPNYVLKVRTAQKTSISEIRRQMSIGSVMAGHRKMCGRSVWMVNV